MLVVDVPFFFCIGFFMTLKIGDLIDVMNMKFCTKLMDFIRILRANVSFCKRIVSNEMIDILNTKLNLC